MKHARLDSFGLAPLPRLCGVYRIRGGGTAWWVCVAINVAGDVTLLDPLARDVVTIAKAAHSRDALIEVDPGDARDTTLALAMGHLWSGRVVGTGRKSA